MVTLTIWNYAVDDEGNGHRVPAPLANSVPLHEFDASDIKSEWRRDGNGLLLVSVLVGREDGSVRYVSGAAITCMAVGEMPEGAMASYGAGAFYGVAKDIARRAKVSLEESAIELLGRFIYNAQVQHPAIVATMRGDKTNAEVLELWACGMLEQSDEVLFDLELGMLLRGGEPWDVLAELAA